MQYARARTGSSLINVMVGAALKAARGLVRDFNEVEHLQVSRKGPGDFVSVADHRSEKIIRQELQKARPDFGFLMEESGVIQGADQRHRWIVDPLDGTTNFLHAVPHFCISIALEFEGDLLAGVVYDPIKDELFFGEKGKGAFLNDRRIRVSSRTHLPDALLGTTGSTHKVSAQKAQSFLTKIGHLGGKVAGVRHYGSAALDLCYVAAGRLDLFLAYGLAYWDMAASLVILREAGGYVDELSGEGPVVQTGCIGASNGHLRDILLKEIGHPQ